MRLVVIGGGIAGLVSAIDARVAGHDVTLLESRAEVGGKVRTDVLEGRPVDCGPTVLTMRWVFDELFRETGAPLEAVLETARPDVLARHAWGDTRLDLVHEVSSNVDAIAQVFGKAEGEAYRGFAAHTQKIYETALGPFLRSQKPTMSGMLLEAARLGLSAMHAIDGHRTMAKALSSTFRDPRLVQLFGRYATYTGSSPLLAPATLNLISHVEREGVEVVRGGMAALRGALETRARKLGVTIVSNAKVSRITTRKSSGGVSGVVWSQGELPADVVVFAGDASAIGGGFLGDDVRGAVPAIQPNERSLSAVTFSFVAREESGSRFPLAHHNVFFPDALDGGRREHEALFARSARRMPEDPTVYLCAQDRGPFESHVVTGAPERFFAILNAPADGDTRTLSTEDLERCKDQMIRRCRASGVLLDVSTITARTPKDFAEAYPGSGGALYGPASHGSFSALNRSGARTKIKGLYLAGGSVHPGAGVPMSALSGRLAIRAVIQDHASIARSRPAAISGFTSTP